MTTEFEKSTPAVPGSEHMEGVSTSTGSSLQRVADYPVVKDSLNTAYNIVQSNSYSSAVYTKVEALSNGIYTRIEPTLTKTLPLATVDGYAQSALNALESRVPIKEDTGKLVEKVRKPADDAVGIARSYAGGIQSRISPVTDQITARITQGQEAIHALQERLHSTVAGLPKDKASAQEALQSLIHEVESLSSYITTNIKELPATAQSSAKPVIDGISEALTHIRTEMGKTDTPLTQRASNIVTYSREQVTPLLNSLKEALLKKKAEAEEKSSDVAEQANGKAEEVKDKAAETTGDVKDKAAEAKGEAKGKADEVAGMASLKLDEAKSTTTAKAKEAKAKAPKVNGKA